MSEEQRPRGWAPGTVCVHGGYLPDAGSKSLVAPIVRGAAFLLDDEAYALRAAGRSTEALIYGRETSPTVADVERRLAALEGAEGALVFSSGMAALHALLLGALADGDHVVASRQLYGGSVGLLAELLPRIGASVTWVDTGDLAGVRRALTDATRLLFCESVSNPTLAVADVPRLAALAHDADALLAVDATFATPLAQRPLALGADYVHHSASKYLGGHSDLLAGVVAGSAAALDDLLRWRTRAGACLDPQAAWLLDRGLKTLHLRMRAHVAGAEQVARFLEGHARVERVLWPGLASHPDRERAERLLDLPGGMVAFVVEGGDEAARRVARELELFLEAGTLGGVESLVSVPAAMSHVALSKEERLKVGIEPGLVRLSVGIEEPQDLVADLQRVLDSL